MNKLSVATENDVATQIAPELTPEPQDPNPCADLDCAAEVPPLTTNSQPKKYKSLHASCIEDNSDER
ncbi:MAG: hypothetical protein CMM01_10570 [Rhodopirellula sp.]|nr:hypothetical protein [Rhodopirellula sp.]